MTTISDQTIADIQAAIGVLRERGWTQRFYEDNKRRVCLTGAVRVAVWGTPHLPPGTTPKQWDRINDALDAVKDVICQDPVSFNDAKGRKKREVIRALKQAAKV